MFRASISTAAYRPYTRIGERDKERGTINDFMEALDGWERMLSSADEAYWQAMWFHGCTLDSSDANERAAYETWKKHPLNTIQYLDRHWDVIRIGHPCPYGFLRGTVNIVKIKERIHALLPGQSLTIPFTACYDARQKGASRFRGCRFTLQRIS